VGGERSGVNGVAESLALLGERGVDPAPEVYARMFARWPETARLFFRDHDHAIRDHMLFEMIEAVLDMAGARNYARGYIATERVHHVDDLTVSDEAYLGLFGILRDVVRDGHGPAWTPAMAAAWAALIASVHAGV
jgi:hemoglobin-like flavoprotein